MSESPEFTEPSTDVRTLGKDFRRICSAFLCKNAEKFHEYNREDFIELFSFLDTDQTLMENPDFKKFIEMLYPSSYGPDKILTVAFIIRELNIDERKRSLSL